MPTLPPAMIPLLVPFAPLFSRRVWCHVQVLLVGAILAPGIRTVAAVLRVMGLSQLKPFQRYHRVLNRAAWSGLAVSRVLLGLLVAAFAPAGPIVLGLDETLERRWGKKIAAKGIYRDAVRSSHEFFVKGSGLRWVCLMLLVPIPWAGRVWALPFLTVLAPSERYHRERGRRHKKLTDWARQLLLLVAALAARARDRRRRRQQLRRPGPARPLRRLAPPGDGGHPPAPRRRAVRAGPAPARRARAAGRASRASACRRWPRRLADPATGWTTVTVPNWYGAGPRTVEVVSDTAVWYHSGLPPVPLRWVLIRDPAGAFDPQALLCTDLAAEPAQILGLVRAALAAGGDPGRGPPPPRRRDPAPVVGPGDPAHHAGAARPVLAGHAAGPSADAGRPAPGAPGRLVPQARPDLRRRAGAGAARRCGATRPLFACPIARLTWRKSLARSSSA